MRAAVHFHRFWKRGALATSNSASHDITSHSCVVDVSVQPPSNAFSFDQSKQGEPVMEPTGALQPIDQDRRRLMSAAAMGVAAAGAASLFPAASTAAAGGEAIRP